MISFQLRFAVLLSCHVRVIFVARNELRKTIAFRKKKEKTSEEKYQVESLGGEIESSGLLIEI